jgi:hypothetical protein
MWGSDYPFTEGVWPFSRESSPNFASIPEADTRKIVHDNRLKLYGFPQTRRKSEE